MPVPKKRHSKSRKGKRSAHWKIESLNLRPCPSCGEPTYSHRACQHCGQYKGRLVMPEKVKVESSKES